MEDKYDPAKDKRLNEIIDNDRPISTVKSQEKLEEKANELYRNGEFEKAYSVYLEILGSNPTNTKTILQMVGCREKMGDFEGAEQLCNLAFKTDPYEPKVHLVRGSLYLKQNDFDRALKDFKDGKEMGSEICEEMFKRLKSEIETSIDNKSTDGLSPESENDKSKSNKLLKLGVDKVDEGEAEVGIKYMSQAIDVDSTNWSAYYERGFTKSIFLSSAIPDTEKRDLLKSIINDLRKSVELQPNSSNNPLPRINLSKYENELEKL